MRYIVDLRAKQVKKINRFIAEGRYDSVAQLIDVAIENQIYIEERGFPLLGENQKGGSEEQIHDVNVAAKYSLGVMNNEPEEVRLPTYEDLVYSLRQPKEDINWLWGQTNKIFPVKIGVRVLYHLLGNDQWYDIDDFAEEASGVASELGNQIREYEEKKSKLRTERISHGLPVGHEDKSMLRYRNQFLAYARGDGKLDGAMCFYRFANIKINDKGKALIGLTGPGMDFARIANPVLDAADYDSSLSEEEITFLINHISKYVKGERNAFLWLLGKLSDGLSERNTLNEALKHDYGKKWGASDAVINTQRAGLMARMDELRLIGKNRVGVKVTYCLSESGLALHRKGF
jgi:hypothetical protein